MLTDMFETAEADPVKWGWNVFPIFDIANGIWLEGFNGEMICIGGFQHNSAVIAGPHAGKSQLALFLFSTAVNRITGSDGQVMDTENTLPALRITGSSERIRGGRPFKLRTKHNKADPDARVQFIDGNLIYFDKWFDLLYGAIKERVKQRGIKKYQATMPVPDEFGNPVVFNQPFFGLVDSLTEGKTDTADVKATTKGIDDKSGNTEYMNEGGTKGRALSKSGKLQSQGDMYIMYTASLGDAGPEMGGGPPGMGPKKKMGYVDPTLSLKKVSNQFNKVTTTVYHLKVPRPMFKDYSAGNRHPKYPLNKADIYDGNTDLEYQDVTIVRAKSGPSGWTMQLVKSQRLGVLPEVTEFHFIREFGGKSVEYKDYGVFVPAQHSFAFHLLPEVTFRPTTFRELIDNDARLRKACEWTASLKSLYLVSKNDYALSNKVNPDEIYSILKEKGYDWEILYNTRSYFIPREQEAQELPYLSVMDLIRMCNGEYHPKWYPVKKADLGKGE